MEEESSSRMAIGIAGTLLGSISFQMAMMYLTNHGDKDIRKYSYRVINETVSIFCAVLLFQSFDDLVEIVTKDLSTTAKWLVDALHMCLWFFITQFLVAQACGITKNNKVSVRARKDSRCYALLLAHLTGFASINACGALQSFDCFRDNPLMSFLAVGISGFGFIVLVSITDCFRAHLIHADNEIGEREKLWDEDCEEAENDVLCLTLSFSFTQALRYLVTGVLPDPHGKVSLKELERTSFKEVVQIYSGGVLCIFVMVLLFMTKKTQTESGGDEEGEDLEVEEEKRRGSMASRVTNTTCGTCKTKDEEENELKEWALRLHEVIQGAFAMAFAWCCFYGTKMLLAMFEFFDDQMILAVGLSMIISLFSFCTIRMLDKLEDFFKDSSALVKLRSIAGDKFLVVKRGRLNLMESKTGTQFVVKRAKHHPEHSIMITFGDEYVTYDGDLTTDHRDPRRVLPKIEQAFSEHSRTRIAGQFFECVPHSSSGAQEVEVVLEQIIAALGILVGFSWEQCFDQAVESLSEVMPTPHIAKLLLGLFCVMMMVPAWKWYVLPMSEENGWKYGFVIDHADEKWKDVVVHLQRGWRESGQDAPVVLVDSPMLRSKKSISDEAAEAAQKRSMTLAAIEERQRGGTQSSNHSHGAKSERTRGGSEVKSVHSLSMPLLPPRAIPSRQATLGSDVHLDALPPQAPPPEQDEAPPQGDYLALPGEDIPALDELRAMNEEMQNASNNLAKVSRRVRSTSEKEEQRSQLAALNQQMDLMLSRMRHLHSQVEAGSPR